MGETMQRIFEKLTQADILFRTEEPLARHTSFGIGGPVRAMLFPDGEDQLLLAMRTLREAGITPLLIGNGSNLLAADGPIDKIAIKTHNGEPQLLQMEENRICVSGGALLSRVATFARDMGLTGLEFAHGIPGTLGGAVFMNAGAYGGEMAQVVAEVRYLDGDLAEQRISGEALDFSYRHSRFSETKELILGALLTLLPGDQAEIQARMSELAAKRKASQPLEWPSGGSTFKRPKEGYAAALIEGAGLKGYAIGGAQVSEKHAGFVINRGGATCDDVLRLMAHIQETVFARTGIRLEPEVQMVL